LSTLRGPENSAYLRRCQLFARAAAVLEQQIWAQKPYAVGHPADAPRTVPTHFQSALPSEAGADIQTPAAADGYAEKRGQWLLPGIGLDTNAATD
jgi:hypothetical protein